MSKKDRKSLVEQHALERLSKVEKEQRRAYKKEKQPVAWQQWIMMGLLIFVLVTMVFGLLRR